MKKLFKKVKGFTLVELAIVIAVIAILVAVLVPTFISLMDKANETTDEMAVKNMNTALSIREADEEFDNVSDVVTALAEENYNLNNYSPLISGMQFYWVKSINRVVYANASDYTISYPTEYADLTYTVGDWYSLNGDINLDNSWKTTITNYTVQINSGSQLASLMSEFTNYSDQITTITLTADIDLMGASYNFGTNTTSLKYTSTDGVNTELKIEGNYHTIYGFRCDSNSVYGSGEFENKGYGYGLFSCIGESGDVTIENLTLSGMIVKDTNLEDTGSAALFAGLLYGKLTLTNVTVSNCYVECYQKAATIVGQFQGAGSVTLSSVKFTSTTVAASYEGAKLIAYTPYGGTQKFSYDNCNFDGITVVARDDYMSYIGATSSFTSTLNGYECLFAYDASSTGDFNLYTVVTQALYMRAFTNAAYIDFEGYTLRAQNEVGNAAFDKTSS